MQTLQQAPVTINSVPTPKLRDLSPRQTIAWVFVAVVSFHVAYLAAATSFLIVVYLFALVQLSRAPNGRRAFYAGISVGLLIALGRLDFFWGIFSVASIALWFVYAFWTGLFVAVARLCLGPATPKPAFLLVPFLWCGLEYFRSELYYLRFSWLSPGLAFGLDPAYVPISVLGTFGLGFLLMAIAEAAGLIWTFSKTKAAVVLIAGLAVVYGAAHLLRNSRDHHSNSLHIAGVQLEFPSEKEVLTWLNELVRQHPDADLLLLSEYTFSGAVPETVKQWCREHRRHLIIGAVDRLANRQFYDTALVIGSDGEIIFRQAKSVPIQFFNDGLPAQEQHIWNSPWGPIGICICYDLSYTRVTDRLVRMGAQMLIVPTMDVTDWGKRQHELHARVGPIRAAEYGIPVVRLASSGISQAIDSAGKVLSSAPCPGQGAMISANLNFSKTPNLPIDRWLAPVSIAVTGLSLAALILRQLLSRRSAVSPDRGDERVGKLGKRPLRI